MSRTLLSFQEVSLAFAGVRALDDVSFEVAEGELFAIIGPNGAGKTSIFNVISRVYEPAAGRVTFEGQDLLRLKRHEVPQAGIARTFQNIELFPFLTVIDNLMLGRHHLMKTGVVSGALWWGRAKADEVEHRAAAERVIEFLEIERYRSQLVSNLPYGLQKRVELGRALAMDPKLLMLDEPVAGMNVEETEDTARFILDIKDELGVTQILVEHDMGLVMDIADRVAVFDFGIKIAEGSPEQVQANPEVIRAYLGEEQGTPEMGTAGGGA
ncbi:MAG TPA: ABC transporter ATP-binding protein [Actinomycetota bacterium]